MVAIPFHDLERLEPRLLMSAGPPPIGVNLATVGAHEGGPMFVDIMEQGTSWLSQDAAPHGPWSNGMTLNTDANGWPLLQPGQAAATLLMRSTEGRYPGGQYVVTWEGTGTLSFDFDSDVVSETDHRMILDVSPSDVGTLMRIETSDPNDPVRNVHVWMEGFENAASPFHPDFIARLNGMDTIRFMHWGNTNATPLWNWDDRPTPASSMQTSVNGVAIEYMIDLANEVGANPWFNIPIAADDNYVQRMAELVRDRLDTNLKAYVELSNEVWNGAYYQAAYANQQGLALGLSTTDWLAGFRYYSQRSVEIFQSWENVFGSTDRFVRVMASQSGNLGVSNIMMTWQDAYQDVDVLAVAPYFDGGFNDPSALQFSVDELLDILESNVSSVPSFMTGQAQVAANYGVELVAYEGGQHIVALPVDRDNDALTQHLIAVNRHPRMEQIYHKYMRTWDQAGGGTFLHYSFVYPASKWGSWGALEYLDQDIDTAPKFKALLASVSGELFVTGAADVPTAALTAVPVMNPGQVTLSFQVTYDDNVAIDFYELDSNDIRVVGPNGFNQLAVFDGVDVDSFGQTRTATYHVTAPSGATWTSLNNGTYSVFVESGQVADTLGTAVADGTIGSFAVNVPGSGQGPTADIVPITPDPRNSGVNNVSVNFTADVLNVDTADFTLTRDGNTVSLSGVSVTALNGSQFSLDLSSVTGTSGTYVLTLATSNITDLVGNPLSAGDADTWVTDTTAPTGNIVPITPDPRNDAVGDVTVNFSESVLNVDTGDFTLTRDGNAVNLSGISVTTLSGSQFSLDLSSVTGTSGTYVLTLATSDITDVLGNPLSTGDSDSWVTNTTSPAAPTISSLAMLDQGSGAAVQSNQVVLTAHGVDSAQSVVTTVSFFLDADGDGIGQVTELVGEDNDGTGGWSWSGIGRSGGGYLAQATDGNGAVSEFATVTALDLVIGNGAYKSLEYADADGTLVTVKFSGGTATVSVAGDQNLSSQQANGGVIVSGQDLFIEQIDTASESLRSGLTFKTKGGDGLAQVQLISGATPVGKLAAKSIDLTGAGIAMTGSGTFESIQLHDLVNGADVIMPGTAYDEGVSIKARRISGNTLATLGSPIKSMQFHHWLGGQLNAPWAGSIWATGDKASGLSGDFGADVTLNSATSDNISLGKANVSGDLIGGVWSVQGDIKKLSLKGSATADLTANCIHGASVDGNAFNLHMTLTQTVDPADAKMLALGKLNVKGWFDNSEIHASGHIGTISVGASRDSMIHAGVASGLIGSPASANDFDALARIKTFKVKGVAGALNSVTSTEIAAWSIGQASFKDVTIDNPAEASALVANNLKSYQRQDGSTRWRWKSSQDVNVLQQISAGMVTLVT